jgi:hypothetical protein
MSRYRYVSNGPPKSTDRSSVALVATMRYYSSRALSAPCPPGSRVSSSSRANRWNSRTITVVPGGIGAPEVQVPELVDGRGRHLLVGVIHDRGVLEVSYRQDLLLDIEPGPTQAAGRVIDVPVDRPVTTVARPVGNALRKS